MGVRSRVCGQTTARVGVISVFDLTFLGYVHYYCRTCGDGCINRRSLSCARHRECTSCYAVPVLDRGEPVDNLLPDLSWAADALRGGRRRGFLLILVLSCHPARRPTQPSIVGRQGVLKCPYHPYRDMYRRQYLQTAGALTGVAALAGCASFGGADSDVAPGVSADGVDHTTVASTARDRMAATTYDFRWRTEGDRLGTDFFQVIHDSEDERLLLRSRDGGAYFVDFYAAGDGYRNTAPGDPTAEDSYETPDRGWSELAETLYASAEQIVSVWVSGYEYGTPEQLEEGTRLDIVGGQSLVPYRFDDPEGHLLVGENEVIRTLQVAGTPVTGADEGEPTPLDSHMKARLTLETDGVEVIEPEWVAAARQSL